MTDAAVDTAVIRPEISLMAHESTYVHPPSAMSEVTDNSAMTIDPFDLTKRVTEAATNAAAQAARQLGAKHAEVVLKEKGTLGEVWSGFLDDLFGGPSIKSA
ncbi:MAG: hypothetical protein M1817_003992 [Caeruleum heppii]|nr:MAG: hypothetical protein M1817_003992 [Caeruleum heppii]